MTDPNSGKTAGFTPPHPALVALGLCTIWILVLSLPMWSGQFIAGGPWSDQYSTGYAWRHWQAEQWKALGHLPQWNPFIFGGLPYVGAMHGDIFYPSAWLRLFLPTWLAMDLEFVVHYILAGFFTYLLLRRLGVSWAGSVVGGLAYQLSGVIGSYVQPGHDGKLFVTTLLPLALLGLVLAVRDRRFEGYGLLALVTGLGFLSPQVQLTQYMLIAAGIFTLYLTFGEPTDRSIGSRAAGLALALAAVVLGFFIGAIQMFPFLEYIPYSPRAETYRGFEGATSYAIPWEHVPELLLSGFVGQSGAGTYWGSNPIKLHSEYLGLPVLALALLGLGGGRRRLKLWLGGIGLLFLLIALGGSTPFYRFWYAVVPFVKQTRAPGMALYVVALVVSTLAAFGVERLERREGNGHAKVWLAAGAAAALLALAGVVGEVAMFLAQGLDNELQRRAVQVVAVAGPSIRWGAFGSALALALAGGVGLAFLKGRIKPVALALALALLVSADLWRNCKDFWGFSRAHEELHASDPVIELLKEHPAPFRVLDLENLDPRLDVYPGSLLQEHNITQLLGHHGNEVHRFDELMGGKNVWENVFNQTLWDLFAIEYFLLPAGLEGIDSVPGYNLVRTGELTSAGVPAAVYQRAEPARYGRLVPGAAKVPDDQALAAVLDPRFAPDRLVLLDPDSPVEPAAVGQMPPALESRVVFDSWLPGRMAVRFDPAPSEDAYLLVGENWYPDWHAVVDGRPAPVVRGNVTMLTVPVPAGATEAELWFDAASYRVGKVVTLLSLLACLAAGIVPSVIRRFTSA